MQYKATYTEEDEDGCGVTFVRCSDGSVFKQLGYKRRDEYTEDMINDAYAEGRKATENEIKQLKKLKKELKRLDK